VTVIYRGSLEEGRAVSGPCIVEEPASTALVLPGQTVRRDAIGNLVIEEDG
jgi:N-methylhydantoinase A/oxoprolinase/acetone carboxylase beta subunit